MEKEFEEFIIKFKDISKKGYIKGINKNTNSIGLTFEKLLGKNADSMYFPDYKNIEIKCTSRYSRFPISLFSIAFDGPNLYEMNRLLTTYGKKDIIYENKYQLNGPLYVNCLYRINDNYFKLKINYEEERLYLAVYDLKVNLIEEKTYIDFSTLKERLEVKLSNLALVYASKKSTSYDVQFRYYKLILYKLKSFETFISLLKQNKLDVLICGRVTRSGDDSGRQRNKNLVIKIPKESIELLFKKVYEYNHDD